MVLESHFFSDRGNKFLTKDQLFPRKSTPKNKSQIREENHLRADGLMSANATTLSSWIRERNLGKINHEKKKGKFWEIGEFERERCHY